MASFLGKVIPWLPAQLSQNGELCNLESFLYAIRTKEMEMTAEEMRKIVCSVLCDRINLCNRSSNKAQLSEENLTLRKLEGFLSGNMGTNIYKFGEVEDEYSFPTVFRVMDYFSIPEIEKLCEYIVRNDFDPENIRDWTKIALYCRSDYFVYSSSLDILVNLFSQDINCGYHDSTNSIPWKQVDDYSDEENRSYYLLEAAAGFLFSWNRCKNRLINHKNLYSACAKLAEETSNLLINNQNADGSWDSISDDIYQSTDWAKLVTTSIAVLALSLCHNSNMSNSIQKAREWLLEKLHGDCFLANADCAHYDTLFIDAVFISDELNATSQNQVSFSMESFALPENRPQLPLPHIMFLHLSDIHYSPDHDNAHSDTIRKTFVKRIEKMVQQGTRITDLIITGDYRHAKSNIPVKDAIEDAVKYIKQVATAAQITDTKHIHLIPGNHDINREYLNAHALVDGQPVADDKGKPVTYHDYYICQYKKRKGLFSEEAFKRFGKQLYFFRMIAVKIYDKDNPWKNTKLHTYRYVDGTVFLYLNTAVFHQSNTDRGKLYIGYYYVEQMLSEIHDKYPDTPIVVLAHHSPVYFEINEKVQIEKLFLQYPVYAYLCGDAHCPWWRMTNGHLEFTAGCIKDEDGSQAEYMYGNTSNYSFESYVWDEKQGWGEYSAFNTSLEEFLKVMNIKY